VEENHDGEWAEFADMLETEFDPDGAKSVVRVKWDTDFGYHMTMYINN